MIHLCRVYQSAEAPPGQHFLVDRLWPRGVKKQTLGDCLWLKDLAPSDALRQWFAHDPARWEAFCAKYATELNNHQSVWQPLLDAARKGDVTLFYAAKDTAHNNAVALQHYLQTHLPRGRHH